MRLVDSDGERLSSHLTQHVPQQWVICERSTAWLAAIQSELATISTKREGTAVRCVRVANPSDVMPRLLQPLTHFVALEVREDNLREMLLLLTTLRRHRPRARSVGLIHRGWPGSQVRLALALAEAGAVDVACSPRAVGNIVSLGLRHSALAREQPTSLVDMIWQSLPWQPQSHRYG